MASHCYLIHRTSHIGSAPTDEPRRSGSLRLLAGLPDTRGPGRRRYMRFAERSSPVKPSNSELLPGRRSTVPGRKSVAQSPCPSAAQRPARTVVRGGRQGNPLHPAQDAPTARRDRKEQLPDGSIGYRLACETPVQPASVAPPPVAEPS